MNFWIEYDIKGGRRVRRKFRDRAELVHFAANPPKGVLQIVKLSENCLPTHVEISKTTDDPKSSQSQEKGEARKPEAQNALLNSGPIERSWNLRSGRLHENFGSAQEAAQTLIEKYKKGWAINTLAREYHVHRSTIERLLKENAIPKRSRRFRNLQDARPDWETAFSKPTPEALYWAGFLMADGYIREKLGERAYVDCGVQVSDGDHVHKLANFVGRGKTRRTRTKGQAPLIRWRVHSEVIVNDLARWGIVPHKGTLDELAPRAEACMSVDFWRGMIDGDGSIRMSGRSPQVSLTGRRGISEAFIRFVEASIPLKLIRRRDPSTGRLVRKIQVHEYPTGGGTKVILNSANAVALCQLLYSNAPEQLCLRRKRDAALTIIGDFLGHQAVSGKQ